MSKRQNREFEGLVRIVSEESECPLLLVEKDYWITLILQRLVEHFGDLVIFKGGTSLSKAWKLIDRFSEDVDVLLDEILCPSKSQQRKKISEFRKFLETIEGLTYLPESKQGEDHGSLWFGYDSVFESDQQKILVEVGFRGGPQPTKNCSISSFIGNLLEKREKPDKQYPSFDMRVLHLKRTLVEKLFALAAAYSSNTLPKKTRHYYDVYCQLRSGDLDRFILSSEFVDLANDVGKHSLKHFGASQNLMAVLESGAFKLSDKEYAEVLRGYKDDSHLYFKGQPDFDMVYKTVSVAIHQPRS